MQVVKVSAVIITYNEEKNIGDAIRSVEWADEVLVVDSESTDQTREIAVNLGARVIERPWPGFAAQKQFATDSAAHDWILSLDADERVTEGLRNEIEKICGSSPTNDGYTIPRLSIYLGSEIRHSGWYPDRQLRFFDRRKGKWKLRVIHESVEMTDGATLGQLKGDLLHYSVEGPAHHARMVAERYAPLSARQLLNEGKRTSRPNAVVSAISTFIRTYFFKLGFLDGFPGFLIAYFAAQNSLLKHLILLELLEGQAHEPESRQTTTKPASETSNLSKSS
jgi:glycosyltransferase involved in cell wall biosynthesis